MPTETQTPPTSASTEQPSYRRTTSAERRAILQCHDAGLSQGAIAQQFQRSLSTINEVIRDHTPTLDLAKRKLNAAAEQMADNVIQRGKPADHVQVLQALDVLPKQGNTQQGLNIYIGGQQQDVAIVVSPVPKELPSETVQNTE